MVPVDDRSQLAIAPEHALLAVLLAALVRDLGAPRVRAVARFLALKDTVPPGLHHRDLARAVVDGVRHRAGEAAPLAEDLVVLRLRAALEARDPPLFVEAHAVVVAGVVVAVLLERAGRAEARARDLLAGFPDRALAELAGLGDRLLAVPPSVAPAHARDALVALPEGQARLLALLHHEIDHDLAALPALHRRVLVATLERILERHRELDLLPVRQAIVGGAGDGVRLLPERVPGLVVIRTDRVAGLLLGRQRQLHLEDRLELFLAAEERVILTGHALDGDRAVRVGERADRARAALAEHAGGPGRLAHLREWHDHRRARDR